MQVEATLAFFWKNYRKYILQTMTRAEAEEYLRLRMGSQPNWTDLKHKLFSRTLGVPKVLRPHLASADFQADFRARFNLPEGFFGAADNPALIKLLEAAGITWDYPPSAEAPLRHSKGSYTQKEAHLAPREEKALSDLAQALREVKSRQNVVLEWVAPLTSAAAWIAKQLYGVQSVAETYDHVFHIVTDHRTGECVGQLAHVYELLALQPADMRNWALIAKRLVENRILLVFHRFEHADRTQGATHHRLIEAVLDQRLRRKTPSVILISTRDTAFHKSPGVERLDRLTTALQVPPAEGFALFLTEFGRFQKLRGLDVEVDPVDSRMKRAEWHYSEVTRAVPVYSSVVKFRALFASNYSNESYHDPTLGFKRLAALASFDECPDIEAVHHEIRDFLTTLIEEEDTGRDSKYLRFLRLVSTSLYWLSEKSIADFTAIPGWNSTTTAAKNALSKDSDIRGMVGELPHSDGSQSRYVMSMGVKSIVQDHWMETDANSRRAAHRLMARRLFMKRGSLDLEHEYPMRSRHNDKDNLFVSETIRHLVRSMESYDSVTHAIRPGFNEDQELPDNSSADQEKSGAELDEEWFGFSTSDRSIWRRSFSDFYDKILMKNEKRLLTHYHGAYSLRLEILQLLGAGVGFQSGHPGMPSDLQLKYWMDLGYTLVDAGKLHEAHQTFIKVQDLVSEAGAPPRNAVRSRLNLAMVLAIQERTAEANEELDIAEKLLDQVPEGKFKGDLHASIEARRGHILYLLGKDEAAMNKFAAVERPADRPTIFGERAHAYIAALASFWWDNRDVEHDTKQPIPDWTAARALDKAMEVCTSNLFSCTYAKKNHEALGFSIALAHLLRNQGFLNAAEASLDQVYTDILSYGCSERTYSEFLREAGRVLMDRGNLARAYAAYLLPCINRARARRMFRMARKTCELSIHVLERMRAECSETKKQSEWREKVEKQLHPPEFLVTVVTPSEADGDVRIDPHFSYGLGDVKEWVDRLGNIDAIDSELESIQKKLAEIVQIASKPLRL